MENSPGKLFGSHVGKRLSHLKFNFWINITQTSTFPDETCSNGSWWETQSRNYLWFRAFTMKRYDLENEKYWETPCHGLAYDTRMDRMDWKLLWSFMLLGRNSSVWKHAERENCLICILFEFFGKTRNIRHVFVTFKSFLVSSAPSFGISDLCYHVKWNLSRHEK